MRYDLKQNRLRLKTTVILVIVSVLLQSFNMSFSVEAAEENNIDALFEPFHQCKKDYTDWDYIYFGEYPQSSISDNTVISLIEQKLEEEGLEEGDVEVDGVKYRVIDTWSDGREYYVWEKIKWRVLSIDDNKMFIMSDLGLDLQVFGAETWKESEMRSWLNETFYQDAFCEEEMAAIQTTHLVNSEVTTENDTDDKVFLLSASEVTNEAYGFCKEFGEFSTKSAYPVRVLNASEYVTGVDKKDGGYTEWENGVGWGLRSNGRYENYLNEVDTDGIIREQGYIYDEYVVVPALCLDFYSTCWQMENDEELLMKPDNPYHHCSQKEDCAEFCYVYFGSYPQSVVTDEKIIAALDKLRQEDKWLYDGLLNDGYKYRYVPESKKYYLYEKIRWRVLSIDEDKVLLQSDNILEYDIYGYTNKVSWEESWLREQLNDMFFLKAFTKEEQEEVVETTLMNQNDAETVDKVFVLSVDDVLNEDYGFCSKPYNPSGSRVLKYTDYAGCDIYEYHKRHDSQGNWWLRAPGYEYKEGYDNDEYYQKDLVTFVDASGSFLNGSSDISTGNYVGVSPAIYIDIDSKLWSLKKTDYKEEQPYNPQKPTIPIQPVIPEQPTIPVTPSTPQENQTIALSKVILSDDSFIYTGKALTPAVTVIDANGKTVATLNYTLTYSDNKNVGHATVTVTGKGNYIGTLKANFKINPKGTKLSKVSAKKKGFTVKWKKQSKQVNGYQIQYSTKKNFKDAKTVTIKKNKMTSKTIFKLKSKKKYYVRIRTYKTVKVNGKSTKLYSVWSEAKTVKIK